MPSCEKASILSAEAKDKQGLGGVIFAATGSKLPGTGTEQNQTGSTKSTGNTVLIGHLCPVPWKHLHFYRKQVENFVLYLCRDSKKSQSRSGRLDLVRVELREEYCAWTELCSRKEVGEGARPEASRAQRETRPSPH